MKKLKVGDKVVRIEKYRDNNWSHGDKIVTVKRNNTGESIYFHEVVCAWDEDYFELAFDNKIVKAHKLIGTTVHWKNAFDEPKSHYVNYVRVDANEIKLYNNNQQYLDFEKVIEKPTTINVKLNSEYEAVLTKDTIKVGCQTFPISIIDDLVKARKELV